MASCHSVVCRAEALNPFELDRSASAMVGTRSGSQNIGALVGSSRRLLTSTSALDPQFIMDAGPSDHVEYTETIFGAQAMTLDHSGCKSTDL